MCADSFNDVTGHDRPRQTVAIVDDDESVRIALARLLMSDGLHVEPYCSAEAFLDAQRTDFIDCVILDYRLPRKNGLELLHEILAHDSDMPVLMISGHASEEIRDRAIENGAIGCLPKPTDCGQLLEIIRWALKTDAPE